MAFPEIKIRGAVSLGSASDATAPEWTAPDTIKGTPLAEKLKAANPAQSPDLSLASLSAEVEVPGALVQAGVCKSVICQNVDLGARVGYRFGLGSVPFSTYAQYRHSLHSIADNLSLVGRVSIGGEGMWGDVPSAKEMGSVHISATQFQAAAGVGAEFIYKKIPFLAMVTAQVNSGADLGHGFRAEGGLTGFVTLAGGYTLFGNEKTASRASSTDEDCQDAAAGLQLGPNALSDAVAKCKDSALPVFEAMAKRITEFKVVAGDPANLKEYGLYLKQFAEGIASAVAASKLTDADAVGMMKRLVQFYRPLLSELFIDPTRQEQALEAGLTALYYPTLPLLKIDPADAAIKKSADEVLNLILESARHEGKDFLPNVLNQLIEIGKDSAWLKSHKHDLLDAAKMLPKGAERTAIEKSLQTTFK